MDNFDFLKNFMKNKSLNKTEKNILSEKISEPNENTETIIENNIQKEEITKESNCSDIRFCKNCGKEIESISRFCPYCGTMIVKLKHDSFLQCCKNILYKIKENKIFKNNKKNNITLLPICICVLLFLYTITFFLLPYIYTEISISKYNEKNYSQAIKWCNLAIKINSKYDAAWYNRAKSNAEEQNYEEAQNDYNKAIELNSKNADYYFSRGKFNGSMDDINKAISLNPQKSKYYSERSKIYMWLHDYTNAFNDANKAISLDSNDADVFYTRANIYEAIEKWQDGINDIDKAIELQPDNALYYCSRGILKTKSSDFKGALKDFDKSIMLDIEQAYIARLGKSTVFKIQKQYKNAIKELDKAIEYTKTKAILYKERADIKLIINDKQGAMNDINIAINLSNNNEDKAAAYNLRGFIKHKNKNYKGASEDFEKAFTLDPKNEYLQNQMNSNYNSIMTSLYW